MWRALPWPGKHAPQSLAIAHDPVRDEITETQNFHDSPMLLQLVSGRTGIRTHRLDPKACILPLGNTSCLIPPSGEMQGNICNLRMSWKISMYQSKMRTFCSKTNRKMKQEVYQWPGILSIHSGWESELLACMHGQSCGSIWPQT